MHTLCYYPVVDSEAALVDILSRAAWFLPECPLSEITIPVVSDALRNVPWRVAPGMDPTIADRFDRIRPLLNFVQTDSPNALKNLIYESDIILKWSQKTPDISIPKDLLTSKKIWRVDPHSTRMEGSFYIEVSLHLLADKARHIEENKSRFAQLSDRLGNFEQSYVLATGPSVSHYAQLDYSNSLSIVCNSVICDEALMDAVRPQILVFADPIFHFGPSQYAAAFRQQLRKAAEKYDFTIFIPFKYQAIFCSTMPDLIDRMLAVPFVKERGFNFDLRADYEVRTTANILTLLLLPLAATFSDRVGIIGCDGRPLTENNYFWNHNQKTQINDKMANIREVHPSFFAIDYNDYYSEHCETLETLLCAGEAAGKKFNSLAFSHIPALQKRMLPGVQELSLNKGFRGSVIIIDLDALNWSGHYMAYNEKLSAQLKADGCKVTVLCRKDLDSAILAERPDFYPCFSRFSWQIGNPKASITHADEFEAELSFGLNEVLRRRSLASEENEPLLIYMYCGGVEHAQILKKQGLRIGAAVHVNLFYLSFRLTDQYARGHRQFFEVLANPPADGSFVATVSTTQLGSRLAKMTGCKLPCAPHPSTGVSDLKFESLRADAEHRFEFRKPLTVLFPSAPRPEKGYSVSCEAARIICSDPSGLRCIVKHAPNFSTPADLIQPVRKVEGMEVIKGALNDEEFLGLFARSQIAVLPYSPDAFAERTSGLLIDALYFGLPCVVLRGTWLSDIVEEYGCGVAVDGLSARLLAEGVRTIADNYAHYRQRARCAADAYFEANSWHAFSEFLRSRGPTAPLERKPIVTPELKAVSTNPNVSPCFTPAGPNRWVFTKAKAGKQNLLIFKHPVNQPTANRELLASFRVLCDAPVQIAFSLGRHDTERPYEGTTIQQKLTPGQPWSGAINHRFRENHSDLKIQFEILDCPNATCTLEIQGRQILESPTTLVAELPKDTTTFAAANARYRDGRFAEAAALYASLAKSQPGIPFHKTMVRDALQKLGTQPADFLDSTLDALLKNA